ncbi:alpha/beta fold hydrolase [Plantibacter sp. Leaf314]|uniref:alpha/beta fold hydrolase n=1 Tax=Plantibacter sp. Leaf314 TaxID=1736333 RepID=UPI000AEDAE45
MLPLDGCSVAFRDSGPAGRAVLFLHGAGADHVSFEEQAGAVANSGRRAVVWDLRGRGLSRPNHSRITADRFVADAEALISELGLDHPVLVGHSLGGNIAQEMVRREPEAYSGLVVIDATWNSGPLGWMERRLLHLAAPTLSLIPARTLPGLMARASAVTDAAQQDLMRAFSQVPKRDFSRSGKRPSHSSDPHLATAHRSPCASSEARTIEPATSRTRCPLGLSTRGTARW